MAFDTVRWFKERSKKLLKAVRAGDEAARDRVRKHVRNMKRLHLQKIQFAVVRECGFESWKAMLEASDEQRLNAIELARVRDGDA
jgi:hypothetical protein